MLNEVLQEKLKSEMSESEIQFILTLSLPGIENRTNKMA